MRVLTGTVDHMRCMFMMSESLVGSADSLSSCLVAHYMSRSHTTVDAKAPLVVSSCGSGGSGSYI